MKYVGSIRIWQLINETQTRPCDRSKEGDGPSCDQLGKAITRKRKRYDVPHFEKKHGDPNEAQQRHDYEEEVG